MRESQSPSHAHGKYKTIVFEDLRNSSAVKLPANFKNLYADQLALLMTLDYPEKFQQVRRTSKHLVDDYILVSGTINSYKDSSSKSGTFRSRFSGNRFAVALSVKDGFTGEPIMKAINYDSNKQRQEDDTQRIPSRPLMEYTAEGSAFLLQSIGQYPFE